MRSPLSPFLGGLQDGVSAKRIAEKEGRGAIAALL
jgi:hypothetical protein